MKNDKKYETRKIKVMYFYQLGIRLIPDVKNNFYLSYYKNKRYNKNMYFSID